MLKNAALLTAALLFLAAFSAPSARADLIGGAAVAREGDAALQTLQRENAGLRERLKGLEGSPCISCDLLARKNLQLLREIARDARAQHQAMADFEGFVTWMTTNLSGYARYIEAGSLAAGFAKILPIPYAGQASLLTKFVSQGVLSLNASSGAIAAYLATSRQFVARVEALDPARPADPAEISELARFADERLLRDMNDVRQKLAATSELSASALSFLESLNHYVGSSDEYWNRTKSLLTRKEGVKAEKGFLAESIKGLRASAENFNTKLKGFDETARKDAPLIKSVVAYDELTREMGVRVAGMKPGES